MRGLVFAGLLSCAALTAAGCNFARFDELRDEATAQEYGNPFGGDQFGPIMTTTRPLTGTGKLAVASVSPDTVATFTFIDSGASETRKYKEAEDINPGPSVVTALAPGPGGEIAIAVGDDPNFRKVVLLSPAGEFSGSSQAPLAAINYGLGVALADVHRGSGTTSNFDVIALGSEEVFIYPETGNAGSVFRCLTAGSANHPFGTVVAGDFEPNVVGSPAEVLVGRPVRAGTGMGSVLVMNVTGLPTVEISASIDRGMACPQIRTLHPTAPDASFGEVMLAANIVGGPELDLIVGAPRDGKVYVFAGSAGGLTAAPIVIAAPAGAGMSFGSSLAVVDLDGAGDSQLVIGEPLATVDGKVEAGQVHIFSLTGTPMPVLGSPLVKASPGESSRFGSSVAALRFTKAGGSPVDELVVGQREHFILYWNTGLPGDIDDRVQ